MATPRRRSKKSAPAASRPVSGRPVFTGAPSGPREVRLSAYYDAAAFNREQDFGVRSSHFEDVHFSGATRNVVLSRFRREVRNNPYLAGLVSKYPEAIGNTSLRSRTSSRAYNEAKELFWFRWSKRCTADARSLRTVEKILLQEMLVAGELFSAYLANGRVQLIASEFCGSPSDPEKRVKGEVNGIVYAESGRPAAYRFGKLDENGSIVIEGKPEELVDARYVRHTFDVDRVRMGRGLPWLLPSLRTARDLYEITRAKTKQIKDANSVSGFLEKQGAADFLNGFAGPGSDTTLNASGGESLDSPSSPTTTTAPVIELSPGTFIALEPGEKANMLSSEYHAEDYKELIMLMLHAIATPVGLPVELWFSGLGEVNFSGFKGLGSQWNARRRYIIDFLEDNFHNPLHFWRISKAQKEGDLPSNPDGDEDLVEWGWRRTPILDDERAARANQIRLDSGEACLSDVFEENGSFTEEVFAKRRDLYIKALVAAGQLDEGADTSAVEVPLEFILGRAAVKTPAAAPSEPDDEEEDDEEDPEKKPTATAAARAVEEWRPGETA